MRGIAKRACGLLKGCWRTLALFEIAFRLFSMYAVFPACKWLFNGALRITGLYYLTADNLIPALTNPLMLLCFAAIFLAFSLSAMLEISCLITCLDASSGPERALDVFQMIREGARDTLRLLRPRNWPLLLLTAFLIPVTYLPSAASPLRLISLPWRSLGKALSRFPYMLIPAGYLALVLLFAGLTMCAYQRYVLEDLRARDAFRGALRLDRGRKLIRLGQFLLWMAVTGGGILALCYGLGQGFNRLIPLLIPSANLQYRVLLPLTAILNFVRSSAPSIACYAFISAAYISAMREAGEELPPQRLVPKRDARRFNAILFYALLAVCAVGLALYDTHIRPMLVRMNALEYVSGHPTLLIAHRGYSADADENTLSAFQAAIEIGVDYVELDVQQTADGVVIVNHDKTFNRVFGVNKRTWETTYAELQLFSAPRTGECPPTLEEVLTQCDPGANFLVELKDNGHNPNLVQSVYDILAEHDCLGRCMIQSSSYRLIRAFKDLAPDVRCGYILSFALGSYAPLQAADFFSLDYNFVDDQVMDRVHGAGKDLYIWTINDVSKIGDAVRLGADGVITDDAPLAKTLLLDSAVETPLDELVVAPLEEALSPEEEELEAEDPGQESPSEEGSGEEEIPDGAGGAPAAGS